MNSIAIVASTLPLPFLVFRLKAENIKSIYVCSTELYQTCLALKNQLDGVKIERIPTGFFAQNIYWFGLIWKAKFFRQRLIFFHECCLPFFDLFVSFLKPTASFYPQVTMEGSVEIGFDMMPKSKMVLILAKTRLYKRFKFFFSPSVGNNEAEYVMQYNRYPKSVKVFPVTYSRTILEEKNENLVETSSNRVLLLLGKGMVSDENQREVYSSVRNILKKYSFECYSKDHPNPKFRLNLDIDNIKPIQSELPIELFGLKFSWVIGFSSTALINYGNRGISILNLINGIDKQEYDLVKKHFDEIEPNHGIHYPLNLIELEELIGKL